MEEVILILGPAVDVISRKKNKKKEKHSFSLFFNIFYENDVEMFGIMVGQNSSTQYAL